jgi:RimJ/RimL family protein N-acetyltransferase
MPVLRDCVSLRFRLLGKAELGVISSLKLERVERFLEPVADIVAAVSRRPAYALVGIESGGALAGFFVVHPDRRDRACWWIGWLALDIAWQGGGLGRAALAAALARLRSVAGCRRVRLLVAPDNAPALRLYRRAGFRTVGEHPATGEWVMECREPGGVPEQERLDLVANAYTMLQAMWLRLWRRGAPPAAKLSGEFHGPPAGLRAGFA